MFLRLLIIFFLLIFGRKFKLAVQLERFGLPIAVISGILGTLMMGRPIPNINGLVKPIFNQFLLALSLGFGQFFVGGLVVKYFLLSKWFRSWFGYGNNGSFIFFNIG